VVQLIQRVVDNSDSAQLARAETMVWDISTAVFKDLDKLNRERGSQLVLLYLPTITDLVPGAYDARRARLAAFAEREHLTLMDLTPEMRQVPADTSQWFFITASELQTRGAGGHYSVRGHQWVAEAIARHLRALPGTAPMFTAGGTR
jgi:hypothetical protein